MFTFRQYKKRTLDIMMALNHCEKKINLNEEYMGVHTVFVYI